MTSCTICRRPIRPGQLVDGHHTVYRSEGGTDSDVRPAHRACHRRHHSEAGDFARWGRQGGRATARTGVWALNLRGVRESDDYATTRAYFDLYHRRAA